MPHVNCHLTHLIYNFSLQREESIRFNVKAEDNYEGGGPSRQVSAEMSVLC